MKKSLASFLSLLLAAALALQPTLAADTAATIQLSKTEGTVTVSNSGGRSLTIRDNMRLYNGYTVATDAAGYAWVTLDSEKVGKLDEASEAEVRKSGKLLELLLNSGNLYFNITEPLEEDESLNIRTSTIVVGIRGTCGWVKVVDQYNTEVSILEGTVLCTITDPVTGQSKTTRLSGGESALLTVYEREEAPEGGRCAILQERFTEADVDGFVLKELAGDNPMCDKIYADSGLDLRNVTPEEVEDRLEEDQRATAEELRRQEALEAGTEHNVSITPVWGGGNSGGSDDSGGGGGGGSTPADNSVVRMTMPVTDMAVRQALIQDETRQVIVSPGAGDNILDIGIDLPVDAGKTLTLEGGVGAQVRGRLTVDGTADIGGALVNEAGEIVVNSANTLRVAGNLNNNGQMTVSATGRSVTEGTFTNTGTLTLTEGARVLSRGGFTLTAEVPGWQVAAEKSGGYDLLERAVPRQSTLTLHFNNGTDPVTVTTGDDGKLTGPLPTPTDPGGGTFKGWYTEDGTTDTAKQVTTNTVFTQDTTLYAVWERSAGDFAVIGGVMGTDYSYAGGVLTVHTPAALTIANTNPGTPTTDHILVEKDKGANLTLSGIHIDLSGTGAESGPDDTDGTEGTAAFEIAGDSTGNVTITLASGTANRLLSGHGRAGLEKNGGTGSGTLTIQGDGILTAQGGSIMRERVMYGGAGIGASVGADCANITIAGGTVNATSGRDPNTAPGVGAESGRAGTGVRVTGGTVEGTIFATDCAISDGTVNGNLSLTGTGGSLTVSGGTINGTVTLTGGTFTISGGEITSGELVTVAAASGVTLDLSGGTISNTYTGTPPGTGAQCALAVNGTLPDTIQTTVRAKNQNTLLVAGSLPAGWVSAQRDDWYYLTSSETGAFYVTGGTLGTDYSYADGVLTIHTPTALNISNTDIGTSTTDRIVVEKDTDADITLSGVNIDTSATGEAAFQIAINSTGNVNLHLAPAIQNTLKSGGNYAGLSKRIMMTGETRPNPADYGKLTIDGSDTSLLTATGGTGAGIGSDSSGNPALSQIYCTANIEVRGGNIQATGGNAGAGIGSGAGSLASNIVISGGNVTAQGGNLGGAGIGSGMGRNTGGGSDTSGIRITGGTVTATGGTSAVGGGAGIGGGMNGYGSDIEISGGTVKATGANGGAGIGGGMRDVNGGEGDGIIISGGDVTTQGADGGACVGSGAGCETVGSITVTGGARVTTIKSTYDDTGRTNADFGSGVYEEVSESGTTKRCELADTDGWTGIMFYPEVTYAGGSISSRIDILGEITLTEPLEIGDAQKLWLPSITNHESVGEGTPPAGGYLRRAASGTDAPVLLTKGGTPLDLTNSDVMSSLLPDYAAGSNIVNDFTQIGEYWYLYSYTTGA